MLPLLDKKKTCGAQTATAGVAGMAGIEPARAESKFKKPSIYAALQAIYLYLTI